MRRRTLKDYVLVGGLTFLIVWLLFLNFNIFRKEEVARRAAHDTQQQLASLRTREQTLRADVNELSTDRGQEATMRETFGVAKPGEGVIIVVPSKVATTTPPVPWWKKWFGWMKFWS